MAIRMSPLFGCPALLLSLLATVPARAEERPGDSTWSSFRGPSQMGLSDAKGLPLQWNQKRGIAWKTPLPGAGASSPIVHADRIYLTCYTGYFVPGEENGALDKLERRILAISAKDGSVLWNHAVPARMPEETRIRDHGYAASTPAADADRVYVFLGKSGVVALSHDGKPLWTTLVGDKTNGWGSAASPVLYKDLLIINASVESESVVALNRKTGKEVWRVGGIKESWNTPVVVQGAASAGRAELIVAIAGKLLSFDPDNGKPLWNCKTDIGWYMVPSVVAHQGIVYALGGRSGVAALAVKLGGSGDVTSTHRLWTSQNGSNVSSPVFLEGHLYWMHESQGVAYCAKAATGEVVYRQKIDRGDQVYASALLADGRLYYLTRGGRTIVLAAKPQFEQLAVNDLADRGVFNASPAVLGNRLLIRSDKFLYCVAGE